MRLFCKDNLTPAHNPIKKTKKGLVSILHIVNSFRIKCIILGLIRIFDTDGNKVLCLIISTFTVVLG